MYYHSTWACDENSECFVIDTNSPVTLQNVHNSALWCIYISLCFAGNRFIFQKDFMCNILCMGITKWLWWSRGSVMGFGIQVRGFNPGRSRRIFQGEKILSTPSFGREVKPFVPCRRFTACKRSLNVRWKWGIFRQNSSAISRPSSSSFHY